VRFGFPVGCGVVVADAFGNNPVGPVERPLHDRRQRIGDGVAEAGRDDPTA
jgi:hypothetical protein